MDRVLGQVDLSLVGLDAAVLAQSTEEAPERLKLGFRDASDEVIKLNVVLGLVFAHKLVHQVLIGHF